MKGHRWAAALLAFSFLAGSSKLIPYKKVRVQYIIRGAAEGTSVEELADYGWIWRRKLEIKEGSYMGKGPGLYISFVDYRKKKGFIEEKGVRRVLPSSFFKRIEGRLTDNPSFEELLKTMKKLGFDVIGEKNFLGKPCLVLRKASGNVSETLYLWKELPLNLPLYYFRVSCKTILEKKAVEIKIER